MSGLVEFLLARIAEDEQIAEWAASVYRGDGTLKRWRRDVETNEVIMSNGSPGAARRLADAGFDISVEEAARIERPHGPVIDEAGGHVADHVAYWDPAHVLRECEAKRRIVALHSEGDKGTCYTCSVNGTRVQDNLIACPTLRDLAAVYADHPDYRDEWRP